MTAFNLRLKDVQVWEDLKTLAEQKHMSANGLLNMLIQQYVARHNLRPEVKISPPADL